MRFKDRVAIVTGGVTGIGKAIATSFAAEVATAALFLASDDASAITGQNLIVSCGFYMIHLDIIS